VANVPKDAVQFNVQLLENGRPQDIGDIDVRCTVYDLIAKFGKPGTYWLTPVDMQGQPLLPKPFVKDIAADHTAFRTVTEGMQSLLAPNTGMPGIPAQVWQLLEAKDAQASERETALLKRLEKAEESLQAERKHINEVQVAMSVDNTQNALETQRSLVTEHRNLQQQGMTQIVSMMQMLQQQQQTASDSALARERQRAEDEDRRHERSLERLRAEDETRRARDQAETERERVRSEDRRKSDDAEAERKERERNALLQAQMAQHQEHQKLMLATIKERGEANSPMTFLEQASAMMTMAKELGLDKLLGGGSGPQSLAELAATTVQEGIRGLVKIKELEAQVVADDDEYDEEDDADPVLAVKLPNGQVVQMRQSQFAAIQQQQQLAAGGPAGQLAPPSDIVRPETMATDDPRLQATEQLPADVRKAARLGLREIVNVLTRTPDKAQWEGIIIAAITANPAIFHYIRVRAIRPALLEAGATEGIASGILQVIDQSGKVPSDIPRV
jgi:hypothetical protein